MQNRDHAHETGVGHGKWCPSTYFPDLVYGFSIVEQVGVAEDGAFWFSGGTGCVNDQGGIICRDLSIWLTLPVPGKKRMGVQGHGCINNHVFNIKIQCVDEFRPLSIRYHQARP